VIDGLFIPSQLCAMNAAAPQRSAPRRISDHKRI
jgi:hypothetical protein